MSTFETFFKEERVTDTVGNWFSILEYAQAKNISISTIRRGIKSNRLKYKIENGKYYIHSSKLNFNVTQTSDKIIGETFLINENKLLRERVKKLTQELDELKMLVDIYEQHQQLIPELPQHL